MKQAKFACSPLGKAFEKTPEKQVGALYFPNKKDESKQIDCIFPPNQTNDLIHAKLKEIVKVHDIFEKII